MKETKKIKGSRRASTTPIGARKKIRPRPAEPEHNADRALLDLAHGIVEAISDKLGEKIVLMDLRQQSPFTDYFVICSANSERQIKAIHDAIDEQTIKRFNVKPRRIEGTADSGWVLMDYSGIIVHIFAPTQRQFYQLEDLWKDAPVVLKMQ